MHQSPKGRRLSKGPDGTLNYWWGRQREALRRYLWVYNCPSYMRGGCIWKQRVYSTLTFTNTHTQDRICTAGEREASLIRMLSSTMPYADQWDLRGAPVTGGCACVPLMPACQKGEAAVTKTGFTRSQLWPCLLVSDLQESLSHHPGLDVGIGSHGYDIFVVTRPRWHLRRMWAGDAISILSGNLSN